MSFQTKLGAQSTYSTPQSADFFLNEANSQATVNGVQLGWDTATQTHAMRLTMDDTATDGAVNPALSPYELNPPLFAQLVSRLLCIGVRGMVNKS